MDFDRLPDDIFLQILQRLPFKERVRVALVSRRFKYGSEMVISRTRALSLTAPIFRRADLKSMEKLIRLSAANLKELVCEFPHQAQVQYRSKVLEQLRVIAEFSPPRLEILKIGTEYFKDLALDTLLSNLPNLRTLVWEHPPSKFPGVFCEKVVRVTLQYFDDDDGSFVTSLAHYCPNVKHLRLNLLFLEDRLFASFNTAFASWPALQTLELKSFKIDNTTTLERIDGLWKLESLHTLVLDTALTDQFLEKISVAFPLLERLEISLGYRMSIQGFAALKKLKHLRQVTLFIWAIKNDAHDQFIRELISCECLEVIEITHLDSLRTATVSTLAHRCPKLRWLKIPDIRFIVTRKKARSFVRSLYGFVQENLTIHLTHAVVLVYPMVVVTVEVWRSAQVRKALAGVNKSKNGRQLSIRADYKPYVSEPLVNEWDIDHDSRHPALVPVTVSADRFIVN